ncbi:MAG: TIR domain-containing protein [Thermoactinospora sp.]|nr:TIR domain-containing protein [Thermoactinospora sp.]
MPGGADEGAGGNPPVRRGIRQAGGRGGAGEAHRLVRYDAFISYSQVDRRIALALKTGMQRLARRRRSGAIRVFRDEERLHAGAHLADEITSALDASRFLIVIVSPDSDRSPWVRMETEHWLSGHPASSVLKVLAPGTAPVADERLAASLNGMRVPRLRDEVFLQAVAKLAGALKGEAPEELIRAEERRRRRVRLLSAGAAVLLCASSTLAVQQWREAGERQRLRAAAEMVALYEAARDLAPGDAASLAVAAFQGADLPRTRQALFQEYLRTIGFSVVLDGEGDLLNGMAMSEDGSRVLGWWDSREVRLWTPEGGREVEVPPGVNVTAVDLSLDGKVMAVGTSAGEVIVRAVEGGEETRMRVGGPPQAVDLSTDGRTVAAVTIPDGTGYRLHHRGRVMEAGTGTTSVDSLRVSDDGYAVVIPGGGRADIWNLADGGLTTLRDSKVAYLPSSKAKAIAVCRELKPKLVGVRLVQVSNARPVAGETTMPGECDRVALYQEGFGIIALNGRFARLSLAEHPILASQFTVSHEEDPRGVGLVHRLPPFAYFMDGEYGQLAYPVTGGVYLQDIRARTQSSSTGDPAGGVFDPAGEEVVTTGDFLSRWRIATGELVPAETVSAAQGVSFSPDGAWMVLPGESGIEVRRGRTLEEVARLEHPYTVAPVAVVDGQVVHHCRSGRLSRLRLPGLAEAGREIELDPGGSCRMAVDGGRVAVQPEGSTDVELVDTESGLRRRFAVGLDARALLLSGDRLLVAGIQGANLAIALVETDTGKVRDLGRWGGSDANTGVSAAASGTSALVASSGQLVTVDLRLGRVTQTLDAGKAVPVLGTLAPRGMGSVLAVRKDLKAVLVRDSFHHVVPEHFSSGTTKVVSLDPAEWMRHLCAISGGWLSRARAGALPDGAAPPRCPPT